MHQHDVQHFGPQPAQAALHRPARVLGRKVEPRLAIGKLLPHFAAEQPVLPLPGQQASQALFTAAVGGRGIQQVDAQLAGRVQQASRAAIVRQGIGGGVFHPLVAAQLYRAQAQGANLQVGFAQCPQPAHENRVSQ